MLFNDLFCPKSIFNVGNKFTCSTFQQHSQKLEAAIKSIESDKQFLEQALLEAKKSLEAKEDLVQHQKDDIEALRNIKEVMTKKCVELQDQLGIAQTEVCYCMVYLCVY